MVYSIKDLTLGELSIQLSEEKKDKEDDVVPLEYLIAPVPSQLTIDTSSPPQRGTFKQAQFAEITPKLPCGTSLIVAKQAINTIISGTRTTGRGRPVVGLGQLQYLSDEVACYVWAKSLQSYTTKFITDAISAGATLLPNAIKIPDFRFVSSALAIDTVSDSDKKRPTSWLLEERIDSAEQGPWRKYINNDSPVPLTMRNKADERRAEFLAFCQHVQYMATNKLVFVSDYQGTFCLY